MLIYNHLVELDLLQIIIPILILLISVASAILFFKVKINIKNLITIIFVAIGLTLLSLLIARGDYSGMMYQERFGWPIQYYSVMRNIEAPDDSDVLPYEVAIPVDFRFEILRFTVSLTFYSFLTITIYYLLNSINVNDKKTVLTMTMSIATVLILVFVTSVYNKDRELKMRNEDMGSLKQISEDEYNGEFTTRVAKRYLLEKFPEIAEGGSLPPQMYYYYPSGNDWIIVHTLEGSGMLIIISADCYKVNELREVELLGSYQSQPYDSFMVTDIDQLDVNTCKIIY